MRNIAVKNANGVTVYPIEALLGERRFVGINGEITAESAMEFVQEILYLNLEGPEPIKVLINSPGGEITNGMLMYDVIQSSRAPIHLYCTGTAYSMAAVLLVCGKKGNRFILPHGKCMLHEPLVPYGVGGKSSSVYTISESLLKTKREMEEILAKHTGHTPEEIDENTKTDHFFTAQEAVDFGLADAVRDFDALLD